MSETKPRKPFIAILAVLVVLAVVVAVISANYVGKAFHNNPPLAAGAAHVTGQDTPAQAYASVTSGAKALSPAEATEPVTNPGRPASPAR